MGNLNRAFSTEFIHQTITTIFKERKVLEVNGETYHLYDKKLQKLSNGTS